jgi:hypothetical protein
MEEVVATGTWMYDGTVATTVRIVRVDYDFWYALAEADDRLEPGESPNLNAEGHLYYVRFRPGWTPGDGDFWPDSSGHRTLDEAIAYAESRLPGEVDWQTAG